MDSSSRASTATAILRASATNAGSTPSPVFALVLNAGQPRLPSSSIAASSISHFSARSALLTMRTKGTLPSVSSVRF